jgi:hypothetical protein
MIVVLSALESGIADSAPDSMIAMIETLQSRPSLAGR